MAEIIEDIKTSILEVTTNQGIILTSDNTQILHTGTGTTGITGTFTIESTSSSNDALNFTTTNGGMILESYRAISIDSNDTTNGINIGTNNSVPVNIGHTGNNINILGNLIIAGDVAIGGTTIENTVIKVTSTDPVLTLNYGITSLNTYDIGFVGERGTTSNNVGWIWNESNKEFAAIRTNDDGISNIVHPIIGYEPGKFAGLKVVTDEPAGTASVVFNVNPNVFTLGITGPVSIQTTDSINGINIGTTPSNVPINIGTGSSTVTIAGIVFTGGGGGSFGPTGPTGPTGPQGPAGTNGATGAQGPAGATGPQGPAGADGATGSQGSAGATGPQGPAGAQGVTGSQGPAGADGVTGPQGPAGAQGATGPQGPAGAQGATGSQGPAGADGVTGPQGPAGAQGATGPQGPAGADGATGPQGPAGAQGATGPQGPAGADGATGSQGPVGATGPQGLAGADGATGSQGPVGATGPQGPVGAQGATGPQGLAGTDGAIGPQGPTGATGPQGPTGATGSQGPIGATGPTGATGATGSPGVLVTTIMGAGPGLTGLAGGATATYDLQINSNNIYLSANCYITINDLNNEASYFQIIDKPGPNRITIQNISTSTAYWGDGAAVALVGPIGLPGPTTNTQIMYNNLGSVAGTANLTFNNVTNTVRTYGVNLKSGDGYTAIQFSANGSTDNGSIKVDSGSTMIISSIDNFYVKRNGSDRLAITNTNSDFMANEDVTIQSNKSGSSYTWNFGNDGNLTTPGGLISAIQEINNTGTTQISLTTLTTTFSTPSSSFSTSLPNGTAGQIKILAARDITAGRNVIVAPSNAIGYSSFTFNESGDSATLLYTSSGWIVINERNVSFS